MTRGYWGGVMLCSLVITGAAGWYLSTALTEKKTVEVPLTRVEKPTPTPLPVSLPPTTAAVMPGSDMAPEADSEHSDSRKSKILFTLKSSSAKKVFVIGSFNKWFRQPMSKKNNIWSFTTELEPGSYEYKFVVDNRRIKDPNNKNASKVGNSILIVKPAFAS